jgi:hypothetical protein
MKILVACEESQAVTKAFRNKGHEAFSCDLQPCSGGHPEWHFQDDIFNVLGGGRYDMLIGHPTCTRLANSGALRLYYGGKKVNGIDPAKWQEMKDGAAFFVKLLNVNIPLICIENPIQHCWAKEIIKTPYSQIIQPYNFNEDASKATCLWLKGLPLLKNTGYFHPRIVNGKKRWGNQTDGGFNKLPPDAKGREGERAKLRSKTYLGIAEAMADQWGVNKILSNELF